jgi:hypothetical protein
MNAQSLLLQVLFGEMSTQEAARQLCEACLEIVGQAQRSSSNAPARDAFTAGHNQGRQDALGQQRAALRTFFEQPSNSQRRQHEHAESRQ